MSKYRCLWLCLFLTLIFSINKLLAQNDTIITLNGISFKLFKYSNNGNGTYSSKDSMQIGFNSKKSKFTSLLTCLQGCSVDTSKLNFSCKGEIKSIISNTSYAIGKIEKNCSINDITGKGISISHHKSIKYKDGQFYANTLTLDTSNVVLLQGNLEYKNIPDLSIPIGPMLNADTAFICLNQKGITLSGDLAIDSCSFKLDSILFMLDTVDLNVTNNGFALFGNGSIMLADSTKFDVSLGDSLSDPGIEISKGKLIDFSIEISDNDTIHLDSLTIIPDSFLFSYSSDSSKYTIAGAGSIFIEGDTINIDVGKAPCTGFVIEEGKLSEACVMVNGDFKISDLTVKANSLSMTYIQKNKLYDFTGGISISELWDVTANLDSGGLQIENGKFKDIDLDIALDKIQLGAFELDTFNLQIIDSSKTKNKNAVTDIFANGTIQFPQGWGVEGNIAFQNGKLDTIGLAVYDKNTGIIEIGETGLWLDSIGATLENLSDLQNLTVNGGVKVNFGTDVIKESPFTAFGDFTVNSNEFNLKGGFVMTDIGSGNATVDLDWGNDQYSVSAEGGMWCVGKGIGNCVFQFDLDFALQDKDITIYGDASIDIPDSIPLIGGTQLADVGFFFEDDGKGNANDLVAGWTSFDILGAEVEKGVQYTWNPSPSAKLIGGKTISGYKQKAINGKSGSNYTYTWSTDKIVDTIGATHLAISASWEKPGKIVQQIHLILPDGSIIESSQFGKPKYGVLVVNIDSLSSEKNTGKKSTKKNIIITNANSTGSTLNTIPTGIYQLQLITSTEQKSSDMTFYAQYGLPKPTLTIDNIEVNNKNEMIVSYTVQSADSGATQVGLYFDNDTLGFNGSRIGIYQLTTGGTYTDTFDISTWGPKPRYIYGFVQDGINVPVNSNYYSKGISPHISVEINLLDNCNYLLNGIPIKVSSTSKNFNDTTLVSNNDGFAYIYLKKIGKYTFAPQFPTGIQFNMQHNNDTVFNFKKKKDLNNTQTANWSIDVVNTRVTGLVYYDKNATGTYEAGESLIANQAISIQYNSTIDTIYTNNQGVYSYTIPCSDSKNKKCDINVQVRAIMRETDSLYALKENQKLHIKEQCNTVERNFALLKYVEFSGQVSSNKHEDKNVTLELFLKGNVVEKKTKQVKRSAPASFKFAGLKAGNYSLKVGGKDVSLVTPASFTSKFGNQVKLYTNNHSKPATSIIQVPNSTTSSKIEAGLLFAAPDTSGNLDLYNLAYDEKDNSFNSVQKIITIEGDSGSIVSPQLINCPDSAASPFGNNIILSYSLAYANNIYTAYLNANPVVNFPSMSTIPSSASGFKSPNYQGSVNSFIPAVSYINNFFDEGYWSMLYTGVSGSVLVNNYGLGQSFNVSTPYNQYTNNWQSPQNDFAVGYFSAASSQPGLATLVCSPDSLLHLYVSIVDTNLTTVGGQLITDSIIVGSCKSPNNTLSSNIYADVVTGDFNGDGYIDVAAGHDTLYVFAGNGEGDLTLIYSKPFPNGISLKVADINGDGSDDILEVFSKTVITSVGYNDFSLESPKNIKADLLFASFYINDNKVVALGASSKNGNLVSYSINSSSSTITTYPIHLKGSLNLKKFKIVIE